jgi:putative ABC transport system substrate-binding protein
MAVGLGAALGCGSSAPRIPKLGYLAPAVELAAPVLALFAELDVLGWKEGRTLHVEMRLARGQFERLPALAEELVREGVDVLVAGASPAALAAKAATDRIPIVFIGVSDPVAIGLVDDLARPSGNVTGFSLVAPQLIVKRVELLHAIIPGLKRVAALRRPSSPSQHHEMRELQIAADTLGLEVLAFDVSTPADLEPAFAAAVAAQAGAVINFSDNLFSNERVQMGDLVIRYRLPSIHNMREVVEVRGLQAYAPNHTALNRRAATYVDRILRGTAPSALPIEQPREFDYALNVTTAQMLGLDIPPHIAAQVTEWMY